MESEEDVQARLTSWRSEQDRKKQAELLDRYLARIKVYEDAWESNQWPPEFRANDTR